MYKLIFRLTCIIAILLFYSCNSDRSKAAIVHLSPIDSALVDSLSNVYYSDRYSDQQKTLSILRAQKAIYDKYNPEVSQVDFYHSIVSYFSQIGMFDSARIYVDSQWQFSQHNHLLAKNLKAAVYATKADYFAGQQLWDSAISNNLQALALLKECPDKKQSLNIADAISLAYMHQGNFERAFYHYRPYIDRLNEPDAPSRKLDILMNIISMGIESGNDSLAKIGEKCLFMAKSLADSIYLENAQPALDYNLACYYFGINSIDSGLYYSNKALANIQTQKGAELNPELIYVLILENLIPKGRYKEAETIYKEMQQNTDTAKYSRESKHNYYEFGYQLALKAGSASNALKALQRLQAIDEEMYKYTNSDQLLKYEVEMKRLANENFVREKEYEAKNQRNYVWSATIIAILALGFSIYIYYHWKKKRLLEHKYWQQQQKQQIVEHKNQLLEERNRIAREMHDDLGTTLTTTFMAVEMVELFPENKEHLQMIRNTANTLYQQVGEVIWNLNVQNDDIGSLNSYMIRFVREFLSTAGIKLNWNTQIDNISKFIPSFQRRMIYLSVKEIINNIVKHAQATVVNINVVQDGDLYKLIVEDDGIGIQSGKEQANSKYGSSGYGMANINLNISRILGTVNWQQVSPAGGSRVTISVLIADE
ncbi:sensor histidine kinase [Edaphocola aurantiacus]|uniref:sensor histidine kinase n=1 Tax=Edaphocola aurantiacus TaxID=2601682 RepID=UPI001C97FBAF|nr:histidine kinase [Edaphocola aurantiacus]